MAEEFSINALKSRMDKSIGTLKDEFVGLRTGRASASLLDPVTVEAYGSRMPLNQVASVSVPEPRLLSVQVWDGKMAGAVEKAIRESGLGLNPQAEGAVIRVPIPELNEERRRELTKVANGYAEQARVAVRHIRRDGMDHLKKIEKDGDLGKDECRSLSEQVQKITDTAVAEIDALLVTKEQEIMQV
jgi:ribosome recycling factor